MSIRLRTTALFIAIAACGPLAGCGGGGGGDDAPVPPPKHALGGAVSGLDGSGLVLHSSAGDDLAIAANGPFVFPTTVARGSQYAVTVVQQPASPAQTCTVANGSGTMGDSEVANVEVVCSTVAPTTFTVGGAVTGLAAGETVVLRNNGADATEVSADGSFTFSTPLAPGETYLVTVGTQPAGQTCTVASGTGILGSSNVTDVYVTCAATPATYTIGGTVSGLGIGKSVVLRNNGADATEVSANGSFTFSTPLASGATYLVSVGTHPAGQTCTVASGTGVLGASNVTGVRVTCTVIPASTYTVGGTVSGLATGKSVVLRNNGTNATAVSGNGPFTFSTPLASGATYLVTVGTQPIGQACTVANGGGTVTNTNVNGVAVTCVTNSFFVGGTVEALVGSGLVLHSDAGTGEDLAVAVNSTSFVFTQKAAAGSTVRITVKAQPTSPAETCTISGSPVTIGSADVNSVRVSCTTAIQHWAAPASWGGRWTDSPTLVQHAYFDGRDIVETKGVSWTVANGTLPAQRSLDAFPAGSRWGAGPFGAARYQATSGDGAFDFAGNMLVCAVVKPDHNPVDEGKEPVIIAKGVEGEAGWALIQRHHTFNFQYRYFDGLNVFSEMTYTPTLFADASLPQNGPLNPSYVVVCAGRDGNTLRAAANSIDTARYPAALPAGATLYAGASAHRLTIGGYDNDNANHGYGGRIYETAIWNEAATPENIQAKFAAFFGLRTGERYTRNREALFVGSDGENHGAWRDAPRAYSANAASGSGGGFLFGLQGWNRLTQPYAPPDWDVVPQQNPVIAYGEDLSLWTAAGGATTTARQIAPPGDSERNSAAKVTLPAGASLSAALGAFDSAGPIHGMMWIRPITSAGALTVQTSAPASGTTSRHDVVLGSLPIDRWSRVWLNGLTTDGTASTATLTNLGSTQIEFYAWGVDLTQIGRGGDLGTFDPGVEMYDWGGAHDSGSYPIDVLQLPRVPTATSGFCIKVDAQPAPGLDWSAPFVADRSPFSWVGDNGIDIVNIFIGGTENPFVTTGDICGYVSSVGASVCWRPTWTPGSEHTVGLCSSPNGQLTLYADDVAVATATGTGSPPDLTSGHLLVGSNSAVPTTNLATWQGFVSRVLICPAEPTSACR